MAVTPNYGWPVPVATDYVKNGYEAIADLGDAIDATVFALPAPASGLTLVAQTTFTAASSFTMDNVFTATYRYYTLKFDFVSSAQQQINLQLRTAGGSPTTLTTGYDKQEYVFAGGGVSANGQNNVTAFGMGVNDTTGRLSMECDINMPFATVFTNFYSKGYEASGGALPAVSIRGGLGRQRTATSYGGVIVSVGSGNFTGVASLYGYED